MLGSTVFMLRYFIFRATGLGLSGGWSADRASKSLRRQLAMSLPPLPESTSDHTAQYPCLLVAEGVCKFTPIEKTWNVWPWQRNYILQVEADYCVIWTRIFSIFIAFFLCWQLCSYVCCLLCILNRTWLRLCFESLTSQMTLRPTYPFSAPKCKKTRYGRDLIPYCIAKKYQTCLFYVLLLIYVLNVFTVM